MITEDQFKKATRYGVESQGITNEQIQEYLAAKGRTTENKPFMTKAQKKAFKIAIGPVVAITAGALLFPADAIAIGLVLGFFGFGALVVLAGIKRGFKTEAALEKITEE